MRRLRTLGARKLALMGVALALIVAALALWLAGALSPALTAPAPSAALTAASDGLDEIAIDAAFDPQALTLDVSQRMTLRNRTGAPLAESVLRAWPNAFQSMETSPAATAEYYDLCYPDGFSPGALVMREATVNGQPVAYRYADAARTVLSLPLGESWLDGGTIEVALRYRVVVPRAAYRFGAWNGICALGNAFVIPAVYEQGAWRTDEYAPVGDPFVSDCANYSVTLTLPQGYACAATGAREIGTDDPTRLRYRALAARDFALVLSDRFQGKQALVDGALITCYASTAGRADAMLGVARDALRCYNDRFGAYPYQTLACAEIDFPMGGMEYPGLVMIASDALDAGGETLERVMAHELAHQWWYAVVGSDSVKDAWQDEALCEFSALEYFETAHGRAARDDMERRYVESAMRVTVPGSVTPGAPIDYFESMSQYALVVYQRGAALFVALDRLMDGGLDDALKVYYAQHAFGRATRGELEATLGRVSGEDVAPLMTDYLDTLLQN